MVSNFEAALILSGLSSIGFRRFQSIWNSLEGDLPKLFTLSPSELTGGLRLPPIAADRVCKWRGFFDLDGQLAKLESFGAHFVPYFDDSYPALLKELRYPPIGIYLAGKPLPTGRTIAIVGTRRCSFRGERTAYEIAKSFAQKGIASVSGLALGIDMAAHGGTLAANGHTVAVLGGGLDIIYPPGNAGLYKTIRKNGTLVSEFSFGRPADRHSFAIRNRIITGLANAVLVVESPADGGSMLSAQRAMEQRRPLFAVPGNPEEPVSEGCRQLIRDGVARPIHSAEELLEALEDSTFEASSPPAARAKAARTKPPLPKKVAKEKPQLTAAENTVWDRLLEEGPQTADDVAMATGLGVLKCAQILQLFCVRGWARRELSGAFSLLPSVL
ncbi:MAG: DNA-processing protein DprA [Puniceicoccales bacterium]|jgi:DNA processing protein|nr:DNA-processing protein DprA [Puniceicoccales bacterium]